MNDKNRQNSTTTTKRDLTKCDMKYIIDYS